MKILTQGIYATIVTIGFMGAPVGAESGTCDSTISNTGSDSHNEVTCEESNKLSVVCKNGIYVLNKNDQTSSSGSVDVNNNTTVGNIGSGDATNENGTTVKIGASCGDQTHEQVTTPPAVGGLGSTTPPSGGAGSLGSSTNNLSGGAGSVVIPSNAPAKVAELPNTASSPAVAAVTISTIGLAGLFGLSRLAVYGYGRFLMR